MAHNLDQVLEDIESFGIIPGISQKYVTELQGFIKQIHRAYGSHQEIAEYSKRYARTAQRVLERVHRNQELEQETVDQIRSVFRLLDEKYGIITGLPVVTEELDDYSIIPGGKTVEFYFLLPNNEKVPICENECYHT